MSSTLYNIQMEHMQVMQMLEDNGGEITPEIEESLELNESEFEAKAASYGYVIKSFEDEIESTQKEIERLQKRIKQKQNSCDYIAERLKTAMLQFGKTKFEKNNLTLSLRKSTSVQIENEDALDRRFVKESTVVTCRPDKKLIKEAIEAGEVVTGAELVVNQSLQIK